MSVFAYIIEVWACTYEINTSLRSINSASEHGNIVIPTSAHPSVM